MYGMPTWADAFTPRQITALVTLSDLVKAVKADVLADAQNAELARQDAEEYSKAITTFLALALDRCADFNNSLCTWNSSNQKVMHLFGRQAIPMVWDYAEANILGDSVGAWSKGLTRGLARVGFTSYWLHRFVTYLHKIQSHFHTPRPVEEMSFKGDLISFGTVVSKMFVKILWSFKCQYTHF